MIVSERRRIFVVSERAIILPVEGITFSVDVPTRPQQCWMKTVEEGENVQYKTSKWVGMEP